MRHHCDHALRLAMTFGAGLLAVLIAGAALGAVSAA